MTFTFTYQHASDVRAGNGFNAGGLDASIGWQSGRDDAEKQDVSQAGFSSEVRTL